MLAESTKVKAPDGTIGIIKSSQEGNGYMARGYMVKFEDFPITLFMPEKCVEPVIEMKELENGQMQLALGE